MGNEVHSNNRIYPSSSDPYDPELYCTRLYYNMGIAEEETKYTLVISIPVNT